ncbi:predicted protein [Arabidopsis lyrata subsp. lyrata]|uniref:Predicted protein n=1 Tax=Arabidopsis lyrata subsp. lyrata TaxID=81972 RepID=D7LXP6_ARALL|nr:predicted protein [Arabidopsis lyrata subsp. lyrata]
MRELKKTQKQLGPTRCKLTRSTNSPHIDFEVSGTLTSILTPAANRSSATLVVKNFHHSSIMIFESVTRLQINVKSK